MGRSLNGLTGVSLVAISRLKLAKGIGLFSPVASIPASSNARTCFIPHQRGGGHQQDQRLCSGEKGDHSEEHEGDRPAKRPFPIYGHKQILVISARIIAAWFQPEFLGRTRFEDSG